MKRLIGLAGRSLAVLALVVSLSGRSDGAAISSISLTGTGFTLNSSSFDNILDTVTLNLTANTIGLPFSNVKFNLSKEGPGNVTSTYTVTVNVTNAVGREIPGFDVDNGSQNGATYSGSLGLVSSPGVFTFEDINPGTYNLANGYRFGGLNGGGHALANGATGTVVFSYDLTNGAAGPASGFASLNFTANPEPTTLLLGSLAMIPAAVVARRRRKAALELIEA